ncbi:MAG TPA: hypothetical protein VII13_16295 [Vicinamibacteria bacterium]|jgi:hypothetical protein
MVLFDGFVLEDGEVPRNHVGAACLDVQQRAFGLIPHAALGTLFLTRRRVLFMGDGYRPLLEVRVEHLTAGGLHRPGLLTLVPLLVLLYRAGDAGHRARFRLTDERNGQSDEAAIGEWLDALSAVMRGEGLRLGELPAGPSTLRRWLFGGA